MNKQWLVGDWKAQIVINRYQKVSGICSTLTGGNHFLMWDFDDCAFDTVVQSLYFVIQDYELPNVHVIRTSDERHYHAYCFARFRWADAVHIIMSTPNVDKGFVKLGVLREYFTLRISPKVTDSEYFGSFEFAHMLKGYRPADVDPSEALHRIEYWTKRHK